MLFNSVTFVVYFLPIVLVVFYTLARWRLLTLAIVFLLVSSLWFYGYWNLLYLPLLIGSIAVNYVLGQHIQRIQAHSPPTHPPTPQKHYRSRPWLWLGIAINLAVLGYYKYAHFFIANLNRMIELPFAAQFLDSTIVLPLGVSFYSFTQIAYLIDADRGEAHDYDPITYALFITFFPQLIAGPILRHDQLIPELEKKQIFVFSSRNFTIGITIFILGLAKKVLIADTLSPWVSDVFDQTATVSFYQAWFGALAYTLQLYFDFSGYSDMAVGLGRLFNVTIPINFNSPYQARSIADFWRRWHITLSDFLRDYLYIPLGGNRKGEGRRYLNLLLTMLLGGLWHGAGWTFVLWGGLHGLYLVVHQVWAKVWAKVYPKREAKITGTARCAVLVQWLSLIPDGLFKGLSQAVTFGAVVVAWVVFRATEFKQAQDLLWAMVGGRGFEDVMLLTTTWALADWLRVLGLVGLLVVVWVAPNTQAIAQRFQPTWSWAMLLGTIAAFTALAMSQPSEFLYFQF